MNPSILLSLTKSPEPSKALVSNDPKTSQNSAFQGIFSDTLPNSADDVALPEAGPGDSLVQDEGEIAAPDVGLSSDHPIRSKPQTLLPADAAPIPTHDSQVTSPQGDIEHDDAGGLINVDKAIVEAKAADRERAGSAISERIQLNAKGIETQSSLHNDGKTSAGTSTKPLPILTSTSAEQAGTPDAQKIADTKIAVSGDASNTTDRLTSETEAKPIGAINGHPHKPPFELAKLDSLSVPAQTTGNLTPDDGKTAVPLPDAMQEPPQTMSTLERHLGGHAATLMAQAGSGPPPNRYIPEATRLENRIPPTSDTASLQNSVTNAVYANTRIPLAQAVGAGISVSSARHSADKPILSEDGVGDEIALENRMASQTPTNVNSASTPKMDVSGAVTQQIADAIRRSPDRPIEIALSPVELGRVRMVLSASDAGITVNILADRPETLDLLRRNIDDLGKSFSDIGYEDISFSFQQGDQTADDHAPDQSNTPAFSPAEISHSETAVTPPRHTSTLAIVPDGIDMRL